jgi:hypothetical protein
MSFASAHGLRHAVIVRARLVDERHRTDILRAQALEPADAVIPRALMIVIRRGGGWNDTDRRGESARPFDAA